MDIYNRRDLKYGDKCFVILGVTLYRASIIDKVGDGITAIYKAKSLEDNYILHSIPANNVFFSADEALEHANDQARYYENLKETIKTKYNLT